MSTHELPDYLFPDHRINIGGHALHYVDEGPADAPPILMLHGNPTWSFYYRHLIHALRGQYRTIVPDHIGMGLSEKPNESHYDFTLSRRVDDLEKLIESLSLRQPLTLIVHDWGGMIGMTFAARHPQKIANIIILNTGAFILPKTKKLPWQLRLARSPFLGALLVRGLNAFCRGAAKDCVTNPLAPHVREAYLAPYNSWHNRLAVHRFIQDIPLNPDDRAFDVVANTEHSLELFRNLPMLICWGMRDFVFDIHFLNRWTELFPNAEVHRFPDAGHYVLEDARDQIVPLVQAFLAKHPSEAGVS